nr:hypothetical protein [Tanacetum cinerariifolium]
MASNPENVRLSVLAKLQEALDEEDILADQILTMMHHYADRFTNPRDEINNLMVLQDHPLVDHDPYMVDGQNVPTEAQMTDYERAASQWNHNEYNCRNYILNALDNSLYDIYSTAREIWES